MHEPTSAPHAPPSLPLPRRRLSPQLLLLGTLLPAARLTLALRGQSAATRARTPYMRLFAVALPDPGPDPLPDPRDTIPPDSEEDEREVPLFVGWPEVGA